jgi:hypothetical protein
MLLPGLCFLGLYYAGGKRFLFKEVSCAHEAHFLPLGQSVYEQVIIAE